MIKKYYNKTAEENISEEDLSIEQSLIKHEIERVKEFANISENSSQVYNKFITYFFINKEIGWAIK